MTTGTAQKAIYKFHWYCGRMGDLNGVFAASPEDVAKVIGKTIYFGEVLGKHSDIHGPLEATDLTLVTESQEFVRLFEENDLETGHNPITRYFEWLEENPPEEDEDAVTSNNRLPE